eukprot:4935505-Amphidinium_carterae.1
MSSRTRDAHKRRQLPPVDGSAYGLSTLIDARRKQLTSSDGMAQWKRLGQCACNTIIDCLLKCCFHCTPQVEQDEY